MSTTFSKPCTRIVKAIIIETVIYKLSRYCKIVSFDITISMMFKILNRKKCNVLYVNRYKNKIDISRYRYEIYFDIKKT